MKWLATYISRVIRCRLKWGVIKQYVYENEEVGAGTYGYENEEQCFRIYAIYARETEN
ncbi:MAG: hypothetical protein QXT64_08465 [Desulfurococcaceae archaeon]